MYIKQDIENMLRKYKVAEGQVEELQFKIDKNQAMIDLLHNGEKEEDNNITIPSTSLSSPSSHTNKITRPTEEMALGLRRDKIKEIDIIELKGELTLNREKMKPLQELVNRVKRMLKALNEEQKLVIEEYYINQPKWDYVVNAYFKTYNQTRTVNQLKNIRDDAINDMLKVINI